MRQGNKNNMSDDVEVLGGDVDPEMMKQAEHRRTAQAVAWDKAVREAFERVYKQASAVLLNESGYAEETITCWSEDRLKITVEWLEPNSLDIDGDSGVG